VTSVAEKPLQSSETSVTVLVIFVQVAPGRELALRPGFLSLGPIRAAYRDLELKLSGAPEAPRS
jgi:hypothetical protein